MKNYDERIDSIFRKYEERLVEKKRRSAIIKRAAVSSGAGAAVLLGVWFVSGDTLRNSMDNNYPDTVVETTETTAVTSSAVSAVTTDITEEKTTTTVRTKKTEAKTTAVGEARTTTAVRSSGTKEAGHPQQTASPSPQRTEAAERSTAVVRTTATGTASANIPTATSAGTATRPVQPATSARQTTTAAHAVTTARQTTTIAHVVTQPVTAFVPPVTRTVSPPNVEVINRETDEITNEVVREYFGEIDLFKGRKLSWYAENVSESVKGDYITDGSQTRTPNGKHYFTMVKYYRYNGTHEGMPEDLVVVEFEDCDGLFLYEYTEDGSFNWDYYYQLRMEDSDVVYTNRHAEVDASEIGELIGSAFLSYTHNFTGKVTEGSYDVYSISGISPEYAVAACDDNGRYHFYCNNEFRPASVEDLFEKLDLNDLTFDETANFFNTPFSQHKVDSDRINEILFNDPKLSIKTKLSRKYAYIQLFASNGHDFMGDIIFNIYQNGEIDLELNGNNYYLRTLSSRAEELFSYVIEN